MTAPQPQQPELPAYLRFPARPDPHPDNVIAGDRWRITVLDAGLVRLQWSPSGRFTDLASQTVLFRDTPVVDKTVRETDAVIELITDRLHLIYDRGPFTPQGLSVQARGGISNYHSVWRFGEQAEGNLGGAARTLDGVDGALPLDDGVLSRHGVAVVDDSDTVLIEPGGWFTEREPGSLDLYVFCYGRDYRAALSTFYRVTGKQPLLPRFALGNWWSRYHPYTADEYTALMDRFTAERLPFTVGVIDMDWHPVQIEPEIGSGWTGYSWNRELFPDPAAFLKGLHQRGLRVTLNVHPADGIRAHEDRYREMATAMGIDPDSKLPVVFDPTDPHFLLAYLQQVHHPLEHEGVDFWWLDWQSGRVSRIAGLDPLWLLNHLHFLDAGRPGGPIEHRPITFSRYAGVGSHRYPVGFSGDAAVSWASLAFQPEFTATSSNVGYGWWSHDIGGHMFGGKDDELATRWVQLGVFSPILRLHSTLDPFNSKEPWRFGEVARRVMSDYLRLRHRLLPYLASMNYRAHHADQPLVQPMYYEHPWASEAYEVPNQYLFGDQLLVAPVTSRRDPVTTMASTTCWLPPGDWTDLTTGVRYSGGRKIVMYRSIDQLPLLARAGAVIPLQDNDNPSADGADGADSAGGVGVAVGAVNSVAPPDALELWVTPGSGEWELIEDADDDAWTRTVLKTDGHTVTVGAAEPMATQTTAESPDPGRSAATAVPADRRWSLKLVGFDGITAARVDGRELDLRPGDVPGSVRIEVGQRPTGADTRVELLGEVHGSDNAVAERVFTLLDNAQTAFADKTRAYGLVTGGLTPAEAALGIAALGLDHQLTGAINEILLAAPGSTTAPVDPPPAGTQES
ncbi:TIM-barrel domain-containing protein [Nakamurella aerolata]|uniref:glycoside hydrolase family 31 protein n=1 Tax=Nakamurella aerolata TaxID=1656892 RepID=UPI001BB1F3DE